MTHDPSHPPPNAAGPGPAEDQAAHAATAGGQYRAWESFWVRVSLKVGLMVVATVAIFMVPKIAGRSSGLRTKAEVRTKLWRQELVESGRATRDTAPTVDRTRDVAIIAGLVTTAGAVVAAAAYVALRPRCGNSQDSDNSLQSDRNIPDHGSS